MRIKFILLLPRILSFWYMNTQFYNLRNEIKLSDHYTSWQGHRKLNEILYRYLQTKHNTENIRTSFNVQ